MNEVCPREQMLRAGSQVSTGAWTELAPAVAAQGPRHTRVTLGDRQLAPCSESKWAPRGRESVGASQRPSMGHPQPSAPPDRHSLGWAAEQAGCAHGFGFFSEDQYMKVAQIKAMLS